MNCLSWANPLSRATQCTVLGSVNSLCSFPSPFLFGSGSKPADSCVPGFIYAETVKPPAPALLVCFFALLPSTASHISLPPLISASDYGWENSSGYRIKDRHPQWGRGRGTPWKPNAMVLCTAALFSECFLSLSGKYTDTFPTPFPISCCFPVFSKDALSFLQGATED